MKCVALILLLISPSLSFGQKIHFCDTTNIWGFQEDWAAHGSDNVYGFLFRHTGDTIVNGKKYVLFNNTCLREDTSAGKVYIWTPMVDSLEFVLYDYTLVPGDVQSCGSASNLSINTVISVDSTLINGIFYKIWHFHGYIVPSVSLNPYDYTVVEGLGCINGLLFPFDKELQYGNPTQQLACFSNDGTISSLSNPQLVKAFSSRYDFIFDNSTSCGNLSTNNTSKRTSCSVAPNPIDNTSKVILPYMFTSGDLVITNVMGQKRAVIPIKNDDEVLVGDQISSPGSYFYFATDKDSHTVFTGKFIRQ